MLTDQRLFIGVLLLAIISTLSIFVVHDHLPLVDLPNHMARHYIAVTSGTTLDQYFSYDFAFTANSAADIPWLLAAHEFMGPGVYARLTFGLYALLLILSCIALSHALSGRVTLWALASAGLVFNEVYFWGFQNYLTTIPFALLALALWLRCEEWHSAKRALLFLPISLILFEMHLLGWFVFAVTAGGLELQRLMPWDGVRSFIVKAWRSGVNALPFLPPVLITLYRSLTNPPNEFGTTNHFGSLPERLQQLYSLFNPITADGNTALHLVSVFLMLALLAAVATLVKVSGARLIVAERARGPLIALLLATIFMPVGLNGVWFVHIRFPFVLAILFIASTQWHDVRPRPGVAVAIAITALVLVRVGLIHAETAQYSRDTNDLIALSNDVPAGARLLPVRASAAHQSKADWHRQAYALMQADAFIPTLFLGAHAIKINDQWRPIAMAQGRSLPGDFVFHDGKRQQPLEEGGNADWFDQFTHVLALDPDTVPNPLPSNLNKLAEKGRYALYGIRSSQPDYIPAQPGLSGQRSTLQP